MTDPAVPEVLKGTLDLLVLKALATGPLHGYGVARWLETTTEDALRIEDGALYPALHRMERRGWIHSRWGRSENNRRARFYELTTAGRRQLQQEMGTWDRFVEAVAKVLQAGAMEGM